LRRRDLVVIGAGLVVRRALFRVEAEAAERGCTVLRRPLAENDRAIAEGRTSGLAKLIIDRRGRVLGGGALAPAAGEMAGALSLLIGKRGSVRALAALIVAYPTRFETFQKASSNHYVSRLFRSGPRRLAQLLVRLP